MSETLRSVLPPIYAHLLSPFFDQPAVTESRATCNDCAMCDKGQAAPGVIAFFRPDVKCCSYHPRLTNYLLGAMLADTSRLFAEVDTCEREGEDGDADEHHVEGAVVVVTYNQARRQSVLESIRIPNQLPRPDARAQKANGSLAALAERLPRARTLGDHFGSGMFRSMSSPLA